MVEAGAKLYRVADLASVWVLAQVYEQDLPLVKLGQEALVSLASQPDPKFRGRVRSEEHTSELQSPDHLVCRLLLEKKKTRLLKLRLRRRGQALARTDHPVVRQPGGRAALMGASASIRSTRAERYRVT